LLPSAVATVDGFVWLNENGDGIFRDGDQGFPNLIVILRKDGRGVDAHKHHAIMQTFWFDVLSHKQNLSGATTTNRWVEVSKNAHIETNANEVYYG
jgi:hypothetical protein